MASVKKLIHADAVLWDFDGTLADTAAKNIAISKQILARVAPRLTGDALPQCLRSKTDYHVANHGADDWRALYRDFFGMRQDEIETAGPMWESYQMRDHTPVTLFDGVLEIVTHLHPLPQGICSANATRNILGVLHENGIENRFQSVIGYENLPEHQQKPAPDGGVRCLQEIFGDPGGITALYIGDHIADVLFARGLAERLGTGTVISVIITHSGAQPESWRSQPDIVIRKPSELPALLS